MTILDRFVRGRSATARLIYVAALCSMLLACGGGGSGGSSGDPPPPPPPPPSGSTPPTSLSCDGYPKTVSGTTQVCLILQEYAQVTPGVSASTNVGNLTGHGFDILNAFVVYARIIAGAADQGSATALAQSVVVNTANSMISATPDQVDSPQSLQIDFEIFTATNTNLTLTSGTGNISVDNYNAILNLTSNTGNASLTTVQGQATVNVGTGNASLTTVQGQATVNVGEGNIDATLSGSGWTGAGMNATTQVGNITVSRPAAYQAAFTAKSDLGDASIDGQQAQAVSGQPPAVVTAGSGAPIMLESKVGDVSVTTAQ
jgi:putative adhesin